MDKQELLSRTKKFALRSFALCAVLPRSVIGKPIAAQLVRSASSVGANYRAACLGRSRAEFYAKLSICLEEVDESAYWIELITEAGLLPAARTKEILKEARELTAIFVASRKTAAK